MAPFTTEFDDVVGKTMGRWHVPGIALSVVHGEEAWSKVRLLLLFSRSAVLPGLESAATSSSADDQCQRDMA